MLDIGVKAYEIKLARYLSFLNRGPSHACKLRYVEGSCRRGQYRVLRYLAPLPLQAMQ